MLLLRRSLCQGPILIDLWKSDRKVRGTLAKSQFPISTDCVFDASLVPETCPQSVVNSSHLKSAWADTPAFAISSRGPDW